jgi:hypothetical protein
MQPSSQQHVALKLPSARGGGGAQQRGVIQVEAARNGSHAGGDVELTNYQQHSRAGSFMGGGGGAGAPAVLLHYDANDQAPQHGGGGGGDGRQRQASAEWMDGIDPDDSLAGAHQQQQADEQQQQHQQRLQQMQQEELQMQQLQQQANEIDLNELEDD